MKVDNIVEYFQSHCLANETERVYCTGNIGFATVVYTTMNDVNYLKANIRILEVKVYRGQQGSRGNKRKMPSSDVSSLLILLESLPF